MKKVVTLLGIAFFLSFSVFAQKGTPENGLAVPSKTNSTLKNFAYKAKPTSYHQTASTRAISGYLKESFEGTFPPVGWTKINLDGGTGWGQVSNGTSPLPGWQGGTQTVPTGGGNKVAYCTWNTGGQTFNDQWLVSPQYTVAAGDTLSFWMFWFGSYKDSVFVLLSTTGNQAADFTVTLGTIDTIALQPMSSWKQFKYSLDAYAGQNVYIAFREKVANNQADGAYIALDLVSIGTPPVNDVAAISIDVPNVVGPVAITPKATFVNNGSATQTFDVTMTITGGYTSTKTITALAQDQTYQVSFDPWTPAVGNYTITVETMLSGDENEDNDTLSKSVNCQNLTKAYCYVAYDPTNGLTEGPAYFYLQDPTQIFTIADQTPMNYLTGGTWGAGNKWYATVATENKLVRVDTLSGVRTDIGTIGISLAGISFDYKNNKLFAVGWDGSKTSLYTINTSNGSPTLIGVCGNNLLINLACDTAGNLYAVSTSDDKLYKINPSTAAATAVGSIGFDASYAQDMEFDRYTNTLYYAAYNNSTSAGELYVLNTTTGAATLVGQFQNKAEITGFAIPYYAPLPAIDVAVTGYITPKDGCGLTANEQVKVVVENLGTSAVNNVPVSYQINNGNPVTETISSIAAGASVEYTFTATANLSTVGDYNFRAYTSLTGDAIPSNDQITFTVNNIAPATIPYNTGFDNYAGWTVQDVNNDNKTWAFSSTGGNTSPACFKYTYNANLDANDYLFSKCINLQSGTNYNLSFAYKARSASYPEKLKAKIGTAPIATAMTTQIVDLPNITNTNYNTSSTNFTVPTTGTYYIGFHAYSPKDMWELYVDDVAITIGASSVEENNTANFIIFPNPAKEQITLQSPSKLGKVSVINTLGQTIFTAQINDNTALINTSNFNSGIYFVKVENERGSSIQKVIVE